MFLWYFGGSLLVKSGQDLFLLFVYAAEVRLRDKPVDIFYLFFVSAARALVSKWNLADSWATLRIFVPPFNKKEMYDHFSRLAKYV